MPGHIVENVIKQKLKKKISTTYSNPKKKHPKNKHHSAYFFDAFFWVTVSGAYFFLQFLFNYIFYNVSWHVWVTKAPPVVWYSYCLSPLLLTVFCDQLCSMCKTAIIYLKCVSLWTHSRYKLNILISWAEIYHWF